MPESTVLNSIIGALGSMASVTDRRAREGLVAAQAEQASLANDITKRSIAASDASVKMGTWLQDGYAKVSADGTTIEGNFDKMMSEKPEEVNKLFADRANKFLTTTGADGKQETLEFAGLKELPAGMSGPVGIGGPAAPQMGELPTTAEQISGDPVQQKRYVVMLKKKDGTIVPATYGATADPNDKLVTYTEDEVRAQFNEHVNHTYALGGLGNEASQAYLGAEYNKAVEAAMRQEMYNAGGGKLTEGEASDVGRRELLDMLPNLHGKELDSALRDAGFDPIQIRVDAANAWTDKFRADNKKVANQTSATGNAAFSKENKDAMAMKGRLLDSQLDKANKAIRDFDANPVTSTPPAGTFGKPTSLRFDQTAGGTQADRKAREGIRAKLVASRDSIIETKANHEKNQAELTARQPLPDGVPMPKFEWNEENLIKSVLGILDAPTPEQSAALAKYGREHNITQPQDLRNIPRERAMALSWVIASSGPEAQREERFKQLTNFAQTQDTTRSAIGANTDIAASVAGTSNALSTSRNATTGETNAVTSRQKAVWDYQTEVMKIVNENNSQARLSREDAAKAITTMEPYLKAIDDGTLNPDNTFKETGASPEALRALSSIHDMALSLPPGSPLKDTAERNYANSFVQVLSAQARPPGKAAFWDWSKMYAETFLRTKSMKDMSPIIERIKVKKMVGGRVESFTLSEGGARDGKPTAGVTVGADELSRYVGSSGMDDFMNMIYSQKAVLALGNGATAEAVAAKSREMMAADISSGTNSGY